MRKTFLFKWNKFYSKCFKNGNGLTIRGLISWPIAKLFNDKCDIFELFSIISSNVFLQKLSLKLDNQMIKKGILYNNIN